MHLKLGDVFLCPSPQFTFRHVSPREKVKQLSIRIEFNDPLPSVCAAQETRDEAMATFKARWGV